MMGFSMSRITTLGYKALCYFLKWLGSPMVKTAPTPDEVLYIESRDPGRTIKIHVYKPASPSIPSPVLLNFHGSGFVFDFHGSDNRYCRFVADKAGYTILDVKYRLAPEHPFPAAVNDMTDAVKWVLDRPNGQYDTKRLSIGGFSAGGNLALAGASSFPEGTFRSVIAFYPPTDLSVDPYEKKAPNPAGRPIPRFLARMFDRVYVPAGVDPKDPRISPSLAPAESFPANVMIFTAAYDNLALEAEGLAEKIKKAPGKNVVCERLEGCNHAFNLKPAEGSVAAEATERTYNMVVELLSKL